jgi:LmbE family N-acetylglucosaminyl deacetylase
MMGLRLAKAVTEPLRILCLGAHSDDIEIGCGATLLQLRRVYSSVMFYWVVFSAAGIRGKEATKGATLFAGDSNKQLILKEFRDGFLPYNGSAVKDVYEGLKDWVDPDLIFTHWCGDAHQDHRLLSELTWNTFRNHLILEYEIPKYDGDMGRPNMFVPLELPLQEHKVNYLFEAFESQRSRPWFDREAFLGLMRLRGMESNSPSGYAEGFYSRKVILGGGQ